MIGRQYTIALAEHHLQYLVDVLRRLPHREVDEMLRSIREQCETQERKWRVEDARAVIKEQGDDKQTGAGSKNDGEQTDVEREN